MRKAPDAKSQSLANVPAGSSLQVAELTEHWEFVGGQSGPWAKVAWKGQVGWVFAAFIREPAPPWLLKRIGQFTAVQFPTLTLRAELRWMQPTTAASSLTFRKIAEKSNGKFRVISISPKEGDCYGECIAVIGTRAGQYVYSDIDRPSLGDLHSVTDRFAGFSRDIGGKGDDCGGGESAAEHAVWDFREGKLFHASTSTVRECPADKRRMENDLCECKGTAIISGHHVRYTDERGKEFSAPPGVAPAFK